MITKRISLVESNDVALLNDSEFERTIKELGSLIIEKILEYLQALGVAKVDLHLLSSLLNVFSCKKEAFCSGLFNCSPLLFPSSGISTTV